MIRKAAVSAGSVLVLCGLSLSAPGKDDINAQSTGVTTQGARVTDTIGRYSLEVPPGWALDPKSRGGDLKLGEANDRVTCRFIMMDPSPLSVQEQFALYRQAQAMTYKRVTKVHQKWGSVGGERAGFLESRRTRHEGTTHYAWNIVTVRSSVPYVIDCQTGTEIAESVRGSVDRLISSFRWVGEVQKNGP